MPDHELEKLLGGFAADTLTADEKQRLYAAALQDQQLFNALADEQALKELLADPSVRRRLLQALNQTRTSSAGSWLNWFRRPAGLAWAGGLAAAALAVVLGTKIYQDSLKQAAPSVATEETKPAAPSAPAPAHPASQPSPPSAAEPQPKAKENIAPSKDMAKKDALLDKVAKRERSTSPTSQEQKASDAVAHPDKDRREQDESRRRTDTPTPTLGKAAEEVTSSVDQKLAASSPPPASAPAPLQAPAGTAAGGAVAPTVSARALYYDEAAARPDSGMMAQEKERAMKPLAESAPEASKPERRFDQFSQLGRAKSSLISPKPLGLRYSFVIHGTDGQDREVDAATAAKSGGLARLTIESNQDAYLQVWITLGSSAIFLLWPDKETGQISVKISAGQRQFIALPAASDPLTLAARLSRAPFGPISRQEAAMLGRLSSNQLQESIPEEQATYAMNQDPSPTAQLTVEIPIGR